MIGRWGRGVTTVISRDDEQVLRAQQRQQLCKLPVEFRCRIGIAVHIVAVAVHLSLIHISIEETEVLMKIIFVWLLAIVFLIDSVLRAIRSSFNLGVLMMYLITAALWMYCLLYTSRCV